MIFITEYFADCIDSSEYKITALHSACRGGHMDIIKYLVDELHCDTSKTTNITSHIDLLFCLICVYVLWLCVQNITLCRYWG